MAGKNSLFVADYLILHAKRHLTPLEINKLVYFSHGWNLGIYSKPLIDEVVEAWKYGPVIPSVYHAFKTYVDSKVDKTEYFGAEGDELEDWKKVLGGRFDSEEKDVMNQVIDVYRDYTGPQLISITHEKGTPWRQCYDKTKLYVEIPNIIIEEFFRKKLEEYNRSHA